MKKIIKKYYKKGLFALFCIALTISCAACGKSSQDSESSNDTSAGIEDVQTPLSLNKTQESLLLGDEFWLTAKYTEIPEQELNWSSSNDQVAVVDQEGKVVAMGVGEAVITATYGQETASCTISVSTQGVLPIIVTEGLTEDETIPVAMQELLNVKAKVSFNGKTFEDASWEYRVVDSTIGNVVDGVFQPLRVGKTELIITGTWRGISSPTLIKTVEIEVINSVKVVINGGLTNSVYLYTVTEHGGSSYETSSPFVVSIEENGQEIQGNVEITKGEDIVSYDAVSEQINVLTYGEAEISVTFTDSNGEENILLVPVYVQRPTAVYGETIEYFSALDGGLPLEDIFGGEVSLVDAYYGETALTITDNNEVLGVPTSSKGVQKTQITVYDDKVGYILDVDAYTKVIDEASDLSVFNSNQNGFFALKNDIEYTGLIANNGTFSGTFDGNGYAIKNAKFSVDTNTYLGGIFGCIGEGALIKNLAVLNADLSSYNAAVLAGSTKSSYNVNASFENIYISVGKVGTRFGGLMWQRGPWDHFKNVIVDMRAMDSVSLSGNTYGALFACDNWAAADNGASWKNDNQRITNVYVLAKENTEMMCNNSYGQWTAKIYASNDGVVEDAAARMYVYSGVKRFNSLESLSAAVRKVGDDQNYWTITETGIEWKGELPEVPTVTYEKTIKNFSALDGDLPLAEIFGDENVVITDAYQSGTQLRVENNKVLGVATYSDQMTETQIIIYTARGNYILNLEAYTMILDEESDLAVFSTQNECVNGYFVLANNIVCTGETVWNNINVSRERYFNGVLDGQGYAITGAKVGDNGIFGTLGANAVIKNIAFTDITLTGRDSWKNTALLAHESLASSVSKSKIENVYVNISDFRETEGGNRAAGLLYVYNSDIAIKDVIVEIESSDLMEKPQYGYGALFEHDKVKGEAKNLTNVYVVSGLMPLAMHTQDNIATEEWDPVENAAGYAANDKDTAGKLDRETYFYYSGVTRCDDMQELSQTVTKVGNWQVSATGVTWVAEE